MTVSRAYTLVVEQADPEIVITSSKADDRFIEKMQDQSNTLHSRVFTASSLNSTQWQNETECSPYVMRRISGPPKAETISFVCRYSPTCLQRWK
jgi:hypothetical protein